MKSIRILHLYAGLLVSLSMVAQNTGTQLFFDGFEETGGSDAVFDHWTTDNRKGWHYWHIIPGGGHPGQCMRFESSAVDQDDWLVSRSIDCSKVDQVTLDFDVCYKGSGAKPTLFYTSTYNGNVAQSTWTALPYDLGPNQNAWYSVVEQLIDSPGDSLFLAFQYQAAANQGLYFLLDNVSIREYTPPTTYSYNDSSQYVVFASNDENAEDYWLEIADKVDAWYLELCSYWDRPGTPFLFNPTQKIPLFLVDSVAFPNGEQTSLPTWKCGYYTHDGSLITKRPTSDNPVYEGSYATLVKNTLGQYMLYQHVSGSINTWFLEAFGVYYSGFRPAVSDVLTAINQLGRSPVLSDIENLELYDEPLQKILATTYMEAKVLQHSYQALSQGNEGLWQQHLQAYYQKDEANRMGLHKPSTNFDFYCIPRDTLFLDTMACTLEALYQRYTTLFELNINHRFNVILYPDMATAEGLNGGSYSMGAAHGGDNYNMLSPYLSENSMEAASGGLVTHEFWHVIHFHMRPYNGYPNGYFIMEGMADYMPLGTHDMSAEADLWKINEVFYSYITQYNREPTLADIMGNPQTIEPYLFGQLFFNYLIPRVASFAEVKAFFLGRCDWSAFKLSYNDIDKGYIAYLKRLAKYTPIDTLAKLPFEEPFNHFNQGWTTPSYSNQDNWRIDDNGVEGGFCARFYTRTDKHLPIESWLISPALNTVGQETVVCSFDYRTYGDSLSLDVLTTDAFDGDINKASWQFIKRIPKQRVAPWEHSHDIVLPVVSDTLYVALRFQGTGEQHQQISIDQFRVDTIALVAVPMLGDSPHANVLYVYPNPVTASSVVSFTHPQAGFVSLMLYDLQGKVLKTLLHQIMPAGSYTVPIGLYLLSPETRTNNQGLFFCRLSTEAGMTVLKVIVAPD